MTSTVLYNRPTEYNTLQFSLLLYFAFWVSDVHPVLVYMSHFPKETELLSLFVLTSKTSIANLFAYNITVTILPQ